MVFITGGVTAPKGFKAAGIHCGIRKNAEKKDLALIVSGADCAAAAVYTTNKVQSAPIKVTKENLKNGRARAIIANSGNANACAPGGCEAARAECEELARLLNISPEDVIVNSTGVIGQRLPVEKIVSALPELVSGLDCTPEAGTAAALAVMTTDTVIKERAVTLELGGKTVTIGGLAKGSGMIHPNMATMFAYLTTDCAINPETLQKSLKIACGKSFNRISVDGDTSTNDMAAVLANAYAANPEITGESPDFPAFTDALTAVCLELAKSMAKDGEGATKLVTVRVSNAITQADADKLAMSVCSSNLVKAAMFGADANWGRVLCAMGYAGAEFNPDTVGVKFSGASGEIAVCADGTEIAFDEELAKKILQGEEITIDIDANGGVFESYAYGCDLTYEYVKINGDYRT